PRSGSGTRTERAPALAPPILRLVCGRYTNTAGVQELNERFKVPIAGEAGTRRFNIAPTEEVLAIVSPKGQPEARLLRWGLIPAWATSAKEAYKMINARVESVATRPAYRDLIPRAARRALQLADEDAQRAWLDHALEVEEALELCAPLPQERLSAAPANPALNKPGQQPEGPELLVAPASAPSAKDAPLPLC